MACQTLLHCTFFVYLEEEQVCKLQNTNFANRICDIVHGTPEPNFQTCLDENKVLWANNAGMALEKDCSIGILNIMVEINMFMFLSF